MSYYVLAGHSLTDPGAVANGLKEADLARELRNLTVNHLPLGSFKVDDDRDNLATVISKIKSKDTDIICDIHFNAATPAATGVEVIVPLRATPKELALAKDVADKFSKIMGIKNRGVKDESKTARGRLGIMAVNGVNVLIEVCFITNPNDVKAYQDNKEALALSLANSLKAHV
jgi:N-acetylmuramoyl-L-alanine amidase